MPVMSDLRCCVTTSAFVFATIGMAISAPASTKEKILHKFVGGSDGSVSWAGLIADGGGNLYGTTIDGGGGTHCFEGTDFGCGTVFKISSAGNELILHAFAGGCDGALPFGAVTSDSNGNLYGTTESGGVCNSDDGYGTVFKLAPGGTETVLYAFQGTTDGDSPIGNVVSDGNGNLFGTTESGGDMAECTGNGCGVVFEVTPAGNEFVLHAFQAGADGAQPIAGVMMDNSGNLFGTTTNGGGSSNCPAGCGTVFEVAPDGTETVLYAFQGGTDGWLPRSSLLLDGSRNLYGTTAAGGAEGLGTVFKVTPNGSEAILHSFQAGSDGEDPLAGLAIDRAGNLYGTTSYGGGVGCKKWGGCGTIFEVTAKGREEILYAFRGPHGRSPAAGLLLGMHGFLYGTTTEGGKDNNGVVFELKK